MIDQDGARSLLPSGVPGLDHILRGGVPAGTLSLIEGTSGAGKTTFGLQFAMEARRRDALALFVAFAETRTEIHQVALSHGWSLDGVEILDLSVALSQATGESGYRMFHPSEVELTETTRRILDEVERIRPERIVVDSLSDMRLLAGTPLLYRRQLFALKLALAQAGVTGLLIDDITPRGEETNIASVVQGTIVLEQIQPSYGSQSRRMSIRKMRSIDFIGGYHEFAILRGGIEIYPRLIASQHALREPDVAPRYSGVAELDLLTGGGLDWGSSVLVIGPSGCGKSSLVTQYVRSAVVDGQPAAMFIFDESVETLLKRSAAMGSGLGPFVQDGRLRIEKVNPSELSPGAFTWRVRCAVEEGGARVVAIDTLNGYLSARPGEAHMISRLHELLTYLGRRGVLTFLVLSQRGIFGTGFEEPVEASFLADTVILVRYFEAAGEVRKAISIVKKRTGSHESTIRELHLGGRGIQVGHPIRGFQGVLTGVPAVLDADLVKRSVLAPDEN